MTDNTVLRTMLLDYYGGLLTEKQRQYYDMHYNDDLSLYEIAEQNNVSRQAVWDIIRRAEGTLSNAEKKIGLVAKEMRRREILSQAETALEQMISQSPEELGEQAEKVLSLIRRLED